MTLAKRGADGLGIYLTGGASNTDPDASLGGVISTKQVFGMGAFFSSPVPAMAVGQIMPANGTGAATLAVDAAGAVVFTPPSGGAGGSTPLASGNTRVIEGSDRDEAVSVTREAGLDHNGIATMNLVYPFNGALAMKNVADADRSAGITTYRAVVLQAHGSYGVVNVRMWMPALVGAQATFSLATETPSGGAIQTVADELTAPTGVSWVTPTTEGAALTISEINAGASVGIWIRRVFPAAGSVAAEEAFDLRMKYKAAS